uniref:PPUP7014 n=1 Tax=Poeciliopsis prolifica TaxID=188132 RepID=A0A0S7EUW7_9TELE
MVVCPQLGGARVRRSSLEKRLFLPDLFPSSQSVEVESWRSFLLLLQQQRCSASWTKSGWKEERSLLSCWIKAAETFQLFLETNETEKQWMFLPSRPLEPVQLNNSVVSVEDEQI